MPLFTKTPNVGKMDNLSHLMNLNAVGVAVGVISLIITSLSLIAAYVFYRRSKSESRLSYQSDSYTLLGTRAPSPDIEITFRGKKVPHVTKSQVLIWNDGNTTIDGNQIVEADPLRIVTSPESEILDVKVLRVARDVNEFSAEKGAAAPNEVRCGFEWLDPADGALIQVFHSGETRLKVIGTLRGLPKGVLNGGRLARPQSKPPNRYEVVMDYLGKTGGVLTGVMVVLLGMAIILGGIDEYATNRGSALAKVLVGLVWLAFVLFLIGSLVTRVGQERKPPETLRLKEGDW